MMDNIENKDEALFESLSKKKKKKKKRAIITVIIIIAVVIAAVIIAMFVLRKKVNENFLSSVGEVVSAEATRGNISTTVSGSGTLKNVDEETLMLPANVEVDEIKVTVNQKISKGDIIATVDMPSVMSAMAAVQEEIDDLDDELNDASDDTVDTYISSGVSGRIKKIFAQKDQSISEVMYNDKALALLSLDGYMAVDITTDKLSKGDTVKVVRSDEKNSEISGTVDSVIDGVAKILVTDNGPEYQETVTVYDNDSNEIGSGKLYINSCLKITGISGTISYIYVSENSRVYEGSTIFALKNTTYRATYDTLLAERNEKEAELSELMRIYTDGAYTATSDGSVSEIIYDEDTGIVQDENTELVTFSPDKQMSISISVDESKILSLEIGQSASISVSSIEDETFSGEVTEINKTATSSSGVTKYSAVITLDKGEQMLPGMTASVSIIIEGVDNAIIIPVEALHQTSSKSYVYTSYDEETKEFGGIVEVVAGISNSTYAEITSGLNEGDTVYYTETESSAFASMSFGGEMGDMQGDFGGGMQGDFGGGMPSGGDMPSGGGGMPSGGGGMPGNRG